MSEHPFARFGLQQLVQQCEDFGTCGEAHDLDSALQQLEETRPDLAVFDLSLQNGLGLRLVTEAKSRHPHVWLVVTSLHGDAFYSGQVLSAGAEAYLGRRAHPSEFWEALQRVVGGEVYVSADIGQQILRGTSGRKSQPTNVMETLTDRELQVFELLGEGFNTKRIAKQLRISPHTVETYRERIRTKIDAKDGSDLTFRAISWALLNG